MVIIIIIIIIIIIMVTITITIMKTAIIMTIIVVTHLMVCGLYFAAALDAFVVGNSGSTASRGQNRPARASIRRRLFSLRSS